MICFVVDVLFIIVNGFNAIRLVTQFSETVKKYLPINFLIENCVVVVQFLAPANKNQYTDYSPLTWKVRRGDPVLG